MRRFRRSRSSSKPVRAKEWVTATTVDSGGSIGVPITLASNTQTGFWIISPDTMAALFDDPTLVRIILNWEITASTGSASVRQHIQVGLIKWNAEATPGVSLPVAILPFIPLPFEDGDSPWIWQTQHNMVGTALQSWGFRRPNDPYEDVKTKRKFQSGEGLLLTAANTRNGVTAVDVYLHLNMRMLFING